MRENEVHALNAPVLSTNWRRPAMWALGVIGLFFGVGGAWSVMARIDSAAHASGILVVESQRKAVQHLEGGIISEIKVRDGDTVNEGDVLFVMDATVPRANLEIHRGQLYAALVQEARLIAEQVGANEIAWPKSVAEISYQETVTIAVRDQKNTFDRRRAGKQSQVDALNAKIAQTEQEIRSLEEDWQSSQRQVFLIDDQLKGLRELLDKKLVPLSRVRELERERERLIGIGTRSQNDRAKLAQGIAEIRFQIIQVEQQFQQSVNEALVDTRKQITEIKEKIGVAEDVIRRLELRAPQAGVAQGRRFATIGSVVRPGDLLVEIAPIKERLVAQVKVSPLDIDSVLVGKTAEVRFPSFPQRKMPVIFGSVLNRSNDIVAENNQQPYYRTEIEVDASSIPGEVRERLVAGMPVDTLIIRQARSPIEYIVEPITDRLRYVMREK
jgi:HlyD family type I secretion membrane fusion protein